MNDSEEEEELVLHGRAARTLARATAQAAAVGQESNRELAREVRTSRLAPKTVKAYEQKYKRFRYFIERNYPRVEIPRLLHNGNERNRTMIVSLVDNERIGKIALEFVKPPIFTEFLAHSSRKTDKDGNYREPPCIPNIIRMNM